MKNSTRLALTGGALVLAAGTVITAVSLSAGDTPDAAATADRPAAITSFPGLAAPGGEPWLESLDTASPEPGTVAEAAGPFDDRFHFDGLVLTADGVTGSLTVTSDVSEIIELEVIAGFYDDRGDLLGSGTFVLEGDPTHAHEEDEDGVPEETYDFAVAMPDGLPGAPASAAVAVPVLVNE